MKLRNAVKAAALAGVTAMLPMAAQADLGLGDFGKWTVTTDAVVTGQIAGCPIAGQCTTLVEGEGFLQQEFVDNRVDPLNPITYIATIVTDPTANTADGVAYSDESYVIADGSTSGVAGQQTISDPASSDFLGTTNLYTGWATALGGGSNLVVNQSFADAGAVGVSGDEFENNFNLAITLDANGLQSGKNMTISQKVGMGDGVANNTSDVQNFMVAQVSGELTTVAGTVTLIQSSPAATDGGTVDWAIGEDLMVVWLGQAVTADSTAQTTGLAQFGYERVSNRTALATDPVPANAEASTFSTAHTDLNTAPFGWSTGMTTLFGTAPQLTMPTPQ